MKQQIKQNKDYLNEYRKNYNSIEENKIKGSIRRLTWNKYGSAEICSLCDSKLNVEHHHFTPYHVDNFIDVCMKCHRSIIHNKEDK